MNKRIFLENDHHIRSVGLIRPLFICLSLANSFEFFCVGWYSKHHETLVYYYERQVFERFGAPRLNDHLLSITYYPSTSYSPISGPTPHPTSISVKIEPQLPFSIFSLTANYLMLGKPPKLN